MTAKGRSVPPDCMIPGKRSWVLVYPQPRASSPWWLVAPMTVPRGAPTPPCFLACPSAPPGTPWQGGGQLAVCPGRPGGGLFPWGWDPAGCWDWGGRGGRMELPLGGQFQIAVWDEAVGKGDFTQPPLQGDVRESALQARKG